MGVIGMLTSMMLAYGIACVFIFISCKIYKYIDIKKVRKKEVKELIEFSIPLIPNALSWWIINVSDRTIISFFLNTAANGIYAVSGKFSQLITLLSNIFVLSWTESAAENASDRERDEFYSTIMLKSIKVFASATICVISAMPFLFRFLINDQYFEAYNYIPILLLATFFHTVAALYGSIYTALKKTMNASSTTVITAIINIVINVALIHWIHIWAAALSTLIAYIVLVIIRHVDISKDVKLHYDKTFLFLISGWSTILLIGYYINSIYLTLILFLASVIISYLINREIVDSVVKNLINRFIKKN